MSVGHSLRICLVYATVLQSLYQQGLYFNLKLHRLWYQIIPGVIVAPCHALAPSQILLFRKDSVSIKEDSHEDDPDYHLSSGLPNLYRVEIRLG